MGTISASREMVTKTNFGQPICSCMLNIKQGPLNNRSNLVLCTCSSIEHQSWPTCKQDHVPLPCTAFMGSIGITTSLKLSSLSKLTILDAYGCAFGSSSWCCTESSQGLVSGKLLLEKENLPNPSTTWVLKYLLLNELLLFIHFPNWRKNPFGVVLKESKLELTNVRTKLRFKTTFRTSMWVVKVCFYSWWLFNLLD